MQVAIKSRSKKGYKIKSIVINRMYFIFVKFIILLLRQPNTEKPLFANKLFFKNAKPYLFWYIDDNVLYHITSRKQMIRNWQKVTYSKQIYI